MSDLRTLLQERQRELVPDPGMLERLVRRRARIRRNQRISSAIVAVLMAVVGLWALARVVPLGDAGGGQPGSQPAPLSVETIRVDPIIGSIELLGGRLWVDEANQGRRLLEVDPTSGATLRTIELPEDTYLMASGEGSLWFGGPEGLVRFDPRTGAFSSLPIPAGPLVEVTPDGIFVLENDRLSRFDSLTGRLLATTGLGEPASGFDVGFGAVWVTTAVPPSISGPVTRLNLDLSENNIYFVPRDGFYENIGYCVCEIEVGGDWVWVCCDADQAIDQLDPETGLVVNRIRGPKPPSTGGLNLHGMTYAEGNLWVTQDSDGGEPVPVPRGVYRYDPTSDVLAGPAPIPVSPQEVKVGLGRVWVEGFLDRRVFHFDVRSELPPVRQPDGPWTLAVALLLGAGVVMLLVRTWHRRSAVRRGQDGV